MQEGENICYPPIERISDPGAPERPAYTGFCFFDVLQFDATGRCSLALKVDFHDCEVKPTDRAENLWNDRADDNAQFI